MIEATVENKYDFNMQVLLPAMATRSQSSALADSDVAIRLGQIHQWVTPTNSRSRLLQQRAIAASGGVSQIAVMDAATRV
jgi:hypothetical protein